MTKVTLKAIDGEIATFTTNRDALKLSAHTIAMMIFYHAAPKSISDDCNGTGDCTRAIKLVQAMPKSWAAQMEEWFKAFTPIRVVSRSKKCEYALEYKKLTPAEKKEQAEDWWKLALANTTPFFDLVEEPEAKVKGGDDYWKLIAGLGARIEKDIEQNRVKPEEISYARAIAAVAASLKKPEKVVDAAPANDAPAAPEGQDEEAA